MSIDVCAGAAGQVAGREEMGKGHSFRAGQADLRTRLRYTHLLASSFRTSEEEGPGSKHSNVWGGFIEVASICRFISASLLRPTLFPRGVGGKESA